MPRRHYLLCYDVADDKRRTRVFEAMLDHGEHTQYSVFLAQLTDTERVALRGRLEAIIHPREDQVLIVDLGPTDGHPEPSIMALGKPHDPTPRARIV